MTYVPRRVLIALTLATLPGCGSLGVRQSPPQATQVHKAVDVDRFFATWNANCQQIQNLRCDDVHISAKAQGQDFSVDAKMAYQTPNQFRLIGYFAKRPEVDLGSNDDEIWFWIRRANPPAVHFCKRKDLPNVMLSTPFQPDWLVEALGVTPLDPNLYRKGKEYPEYYTLLAEMKTPSGQPVTKRIVVSRQDHRVVAFELFDVTQRRLAEVRIREYYDDPTTGIFIPKLIQVDWREADTSLTLSMRPKRIQFNSITPDLAATFFRRGEYLNTEVVDLARMGRVATAQGSPSNLAGRRASGGLDRQVRPAQAAELTGEIQLQPPPGAN